MLHDQIKGKLSFHIYYNMRSPDDQASRSGHWSTMKWNILNSKTKDQESQGKEQHKKANNKSIDLHTKSKPDAKKTSQNIEVKIFRK